MGSQARLTVDRLVPYLEAAAMAVLRQGFSGNWIGHAEDFEARAYWTSEKTITFEVTLR